MKKILILVTTFIASFQISCKKDIEVVPGPDYRNLGLSGSYELSEVKRVDENYLEKPLSDDGLDVELNNTANYGDYKTWKIEFNDDASELKSLKVNRWTANTSAGALIESGTKTYEWALSSAVTSTFLIREKGTTTSLLTMAKSGDNKIIYTVTAIRFKAGLQGNVEFHFIKK